MGLYLKSQIDSAIVHKSNIKYLYVYLSLFLNKCLKRTRVPKPGIKDRDK